MKKTEINKYLTEELFKECWNKFTWYIKNGMMVR